ncbi:MAG: ATP-binding protein [Patescibacteria group bacterium]
MEENSIKLKRVELDYQEAMDWHKAKDNLNRRLLAAKIVEATSALEQKINDLSQTEGAMINILEDSRELEEILEKERDSIKTVISSMGEGLIVIDKDYKVIFLNPIAEKVLETSLAEAKGRNIKTIAPVYKGDQRLKDEELPAFKMFQTGEAVKIELEDNFYYQLASGKKIPITLVDAPLKGNGITGAVIVFRDITEEKKLEEAKSNFLSVASHQLRTPLTAIRWYAEMLSAGDAGKLKKQQKEFVGEIYGSVLKMIEMINTFLVLSRIESGRTKNEPIEINLAKFTEEIIHDFKPLIEGKNLKVQLAVDDNLPIVVSDKIMLRQVIANLLSNGINYANNKGEILMGIKAKGKEIIYSVKDNGIGIPENQKDKIFERFFRAGNAQLKVPSGTGLGLSLVKQVVELWKGKIWFESQEGKGTIFYFTIPIN